MKALLGIFIVSTAILLGKLTAVRVEMRDIQSRATALENAFNVEKQQLAERIKELKSLNEALEHHSEGVNSRAELTASRLAETEREVFRWKEIARNQGMQLFETKANLEGAERTAKMERGEAKFATKQLREALDQVAALEARPQSITVPPPIVYEVVEADDIIDRLENDVDRSSGWQYPQPIDPTDWIQRTLTSPPRDPWKQIRGK